MKKTVLMLAVASLPALAHAQSGGVSKRAAKYQYPELHNKAVPGSPILSQPALLQGTSGPVKGEGSGWGDPVLFDWNKDGKKDLLVGEFMSMMSMADRKTDLKVKGSHIRVYYNVGTNAAPEFTDDFVYAEDKTGAYLNVITGCCIGFTPRFYDLNTDGHVDIITGSFLGQVTCYYGSIDGFESPVDLEQKDFPKLGEISATNNAMDPKSSLYWSYSSADFVDVDGDGLLDLITGGAALRVSRNIGTKSNPVFDKREMLLDTKGNILTLCKNPERDEYPAGVYSAVPLVTDWDQDGVPDMLVTSDYTSKEQPAISFFRGVRQNGVLRFEKPVSLFDAGDQSKQFPGSWLRTWVADWNDDGIHDLIIGTSVATIGNGEIDPMLSWEWEKDTEIKKSSPKHLPAMFLAPFKKAVEKQKEKAIALGIITEDEKEAYGNKIMGMAHQGYVYILLGKGIHKK